MAIRSKPVRGRALTAWKNISLLDVGKLSAVSGKPRTKFLRELPQKMRAEIERNWKARTDAQKAAGKPVWVSNPLIRSGDPFTSRKHPGKVYIPVEHGGIYYKAHLEGSEGKVIKRERLKHPFRRARSLPYAIASAVVTIVKTPRGKKYLYIQRRSMNVERYKGWVHFQPAKYPVAERKKGKGPFLGLRGHVLKAAQIEVGIPASRIRFLGEGLRPARGKNVPGLVIRLPAKGHSEMHLFPIIEVRATEAEIVKFQKKAEHSWEAEGGPLLVELEPKKIRAFFKENKAIYPQVVEMLIRELRSSK